MFIYKGLRDPPFGHSSFYRSICFITIIINNGFKGISHYYNFFSYNYVWQPLFPVTPSFPVFGLLTLPPVSFPGVLNEFLQQLNCRSTRTSGYRDYKEKELSPIRQYPQSIFENSQKKPTKHHRIKTIWSSSARTAPNPSASPTPACLNVTWGIDDIGLEVRRGHDL